MPMLSSRANPIQATPLTLYISPKAALQRRAITARIGPWRITAPHMTTGEWVDVLAGAGWLDQWRMEGDRKRDPEMIGAHMGTLALADAGTRYRIYTAITKAEISARDVAEALRKMFAHAAGTSWWSAERIMAPSMAPAGLGALMWRAGMRPDQTPLPVWIGVAYRELMTTTPGNERSALDHQLTTPPTGYASDIPLPKTMDELFI